MNRKFNYFVLGIPITLIATYGIFNILANRNQLSQLIAFIGLFALGMGLNVCGVRAKKVKKPEFQPGIINLNGERKLHELEHYDA
ncbi:hypothetical protein [Lacrimispora sp.]|uniref:hypothetical protein n=1 Tax=Lacrimispora sp. TaxID=2719234 RepID=UPI00289B7BE9|nr:hypothetical protein [Lacrimispora sp.]